MELTNSDMISWWVADVKLFPSVCCLWDWRARGDHVQQVLPLAGVDGGWHLVTRQAGVHVGHGDSCEHAADEQVRVWNRLQAIVMLLSKVNSEKKRCYDSESTWVYHFSSSQNKEIVVEGEKTMDHRGETKGKTWTTNRETTGLLGHIETKASFTHVFLTISGKVTSGCGLMWPGLDDWTNVGWLQLAKPGCFAG